MAIWNDILLRIESNSIKDAFLELRCYILELESRVEKLEQETVSDVHVHVKALVNQIQKLENEIQSLKG
jgi:hypothetical protein